VLGVGRMPDAGDLTRGVELSRVVGVTCAALAAAVAGSGQQAALTADVDIIGSTQRGRGPYVG